MGGGCDRNGSEKRTAVEPRTAPTGTGHPDSRKRLASCLPTFQDTIETFRYRATRLAPKYEKLRSRISATSRRNALDT